ncbi:MAG: sugar transporter [Rhizobacter sp.]|nr:sugar transporter [Rhizobacter sp.]
MKRRSLIRLATSLPSAALLFAVGADVHAQTPLAGTRITVASMNDPFAAAFVTLAPEFKKKTGIDVKVDILSYPELLSKLTADFVGKTKNYDVVTMDIVWAGQFAETGYTVNLGDWIKRDAAQIQVDDIYPAVLAGLGNYKGAQIAFPFAAYSNVLVYRKDLFTAAGIKPPETMDEMIASAAKITDPAKNVYGWAGNGRKGAPAAQDWMTYNSQIGGSILDAAGKPSLNSAANVKSLTVYRDLFTKSAPPGATNYDWAARHEAYRQGLVASHETWSISLASYENPELSKVVGKTGVMLAPTAAGMPKVYGMGGWALGINSTIDANKQAAAWEFIKWASSAETQKEFLNLGVGVFTRKSTVQDPAMQAKYPFLKVIDLSLQNADADFRPRIAQYPQLQDLLGTAVNSALVGGVDPKVALDEAQAKAARLF